MSLVTQRGRLSQKYLGRRDAYPLWLLFFYRRSMTVTSNGPLVYALHNAINSRFSFHSTQPC
jgi:hypothetical protein